MSPQSASWKVSRYVIPIEVDDLDIVLLFCSFSGRLLEVPPAYRGVAKDLLAAPNDTHTAKHTKLHRMFIEQGFLIPDTFDEMEHLTTQHRRSKFQPTNTLGLTICPTLNCNFRCTYCYQHHLKGVMGGDVRDRIAAYVAMYDGLENLHVTWFGGEPLLAMTVIEDLSERFLAGPHRYSASIVTNGSRLTPAHSRRLVELNVTRAQITLDGPSDLHDQRRPLAGGAPTFDAIVSNIRQADPRLRISIRVNVDSRNAHGVQRLMDDLTEAGLRGRVAVYFAPVEPYTKVCADVVDDCVTGEEWARLQTELDHIASRHGFASPSLPSPRQNVCMADRASDFVVVPSGLVFKCWNDVTDPSRAVFDLGTDGQTAEMKANQRQWSEWSSFRFEDCRSCHVLPLCLGGCPMWACN